MLKSFAPRKCVEESQYARTLFVFFMQLSKFSNNQSQYKRGCPLGHPTFGELSWSEIIEGKPGIVFMIWTL